MLALVEMIIWGGVETAYAGTIQYSFTTIDYPAKGINDSGQIVGYFGDAAGLHGFLYSGGSFTTIDVPGAVQTIANGINDSGQIVGSFSDAAGHGFLDSGGTFTTIDAPGALSTDARGINDSGQIVGAGSYSFEHGSRFIGFLDSGGTFTAIVRGF
jgi:probable HAF family extracellular repeat protein